MMASGPPYSRTGGDEVEALVAHTLRDEGFDASEDGTGRGTPLVPSVANPLTHRMHKGINTTVDEGQTPIPVAFDTTQITSKANYSRPKTGDPCHPLAAKGHPPAIAFQGGSQQDQVMTPDAVCPSLAHSSNAHGGHHQPKVMQSMAVRRLTPRECERLQGFPDDFTRIPWRGKGPEDCPDGHRYRALGNSMAVNCMRWLGERIQMVEEIEVLVQPQKRSAR